MADAQITHASLGEQRPIVLVTDDDALTRLIELETTELALPLECVDTVEREIEDGRIVLLDLDSHGGMQAALHGLVDRFIGICRQAAALPTLLGTRAIHLLERPFATAELRVLLGHLRGGVLPPSLPLITTPAAVRGVLPLWMEDDGALHCGDVIVRLTPKETVLMRCLLDERGKTVTRERLQACLASTGGNEVEVYLCYLRRKLEKPTGRRLITTVRGVGYRLEWGEM